MEIVVAIYGMGILSVIVGSRMILRGLRWTSLPPAVLPRPADAIDRLRAARSPSWLPPVLVLGGATLVAGPVMAFVAHL